MDELVAIPRGAPRWLLPARGGAAAVRAFDLSSPGRPVPAAAARLTKFGLRVPPLARAIAGLGAEPSASIAADVSWARAVLSDALDEPPATIVGWTGEPRRFPKLTLAALDAEAAPRAYVKVAASGHSIGRVRHEAEVLERIADSPFAERAPRVIATAERDGAMLLAVSPLPGRRLRPRSGLDARAGATAEAIGALPAAGSFDQHLEALRARWTDAERDAPDGAGVVARALDAGAGVDADDRRLVFSHGDFTPWNCLDDGSVVRVVDWELAAPRPPLWDLFHYEAQVEVFARRRADPKAGAALAALPDRLIALGLAGGRSRERVDRLALLYLAEAALDLMEFGMPGVPRPLRARLVAARAILGRL